MKSANIQDNNINGEMLFSEENTERTNQNPNIRLNPILGLIVVLIPLTSILFYFYYRKRSLRAAAHVSLLGSITFFVINTILLYYVLLLGVQ